MKLALLICTFIWITDCKTQVLERVFTGNNLYVANATSDSLNYYFSYSGGGIKRIDGQNQVSDLTTFQDNGYTIGDNLICNEGKCLYYFITGTSGADGIFTYYLFNGLTTDSLYTSLNEIKNDYVINGNEVFFQDTKAVYRSSLNGPGDFTKLYESTTTNLYYGITNLTRFNNTLIFRDRVSSSANSIIYQLDMATGQVQAIDSVSSEKGQLVDGNNFYYLQDIGIPTEKIKMLDQNGVTTTIYENSGFEAYSLTDIMAVSPSGIIATGFKTGAMGILVLINNGVLTELNLSTTGSSYPYQIQQFKRAGALTYFEAQSFGSEISSFDRAMWVTDGTLSGTKKIVSDGDLDMPDSFYPHLVQKYVGTCDEKLWIGNAYRNTVFIDASSNRLSSTDTLQSAAGFYPVELGKYLFFHGGLNFGTHHIYKISCNENASIAEKSSNLEANVFPNPSNNLIEIRFPVLGNKPSEISLRDLNGNELKQQKNSTGIVQFDLSDFSDGLYFVKIENERGSAVLKIVKQ